MSCYCQVGLHVECISLFPNTDGSYTCCCDIPVMEIKPESATNDTQRPYKNDEAVGDVLSTGRKRAADLFPITSGMRCEWAGLLYAGGGPLPIIGCKDNVLGSSRTEYSRHHGPDKNTLNNEVGNVHRICPTCHNRWHTLNDGFYGTRPDAGLPFLPLFGTSVTPHDPITQATPEQLAKSELWWSLPQKERGKYRD